MRFPEWSWKWAWTAFLRWALDPVLQDELSGRQRWEVIYCSVGPGIRHHYLRPTAAWLHRYLPTWVLLPRLQHHGAGWYCIPTTSVALHVERRLGVHVLEGDFVRIESGEVTAVGVLDEDQCCSEFWYVDEWVMAP